MLIYFLPDKSGRVFLSPVEKNRVEMDCAVVDIPGLVSLIEDKCGLPHADTSFNRRLCDYYVAMKRWLASHQDNILWPSFSLDELSMARQALTWRDELMLAGWDFSDDEESSRLGALAAIEKGFEADGFPDHLRATVAVVEHEAEGRFSDLEILLPYERRLLDPLIARLVDGLEARGATVGVIKRASGNGNIGKLRRLLLDKDSKGQVALDPADRSFRILKFRQRSDEEDCIVHSDALAAPLWIIPDNKALDNRLAAWGSPTTGSSVIARSRIVGLLRLMLSMFARPINIKNLVEWLSSPVHPLPSRFRYRLAEQIASSGGFLNDGCAETIEDYIEGKFEKTEEADTAEPDKDRAAKDRRLRKSRLSKLHLYLPYLYEDGVSVTASLVELSKWARQRINMLPDDSDKDALAQQYSELADGIDNMLLIARENDIENLSAETLLKWSGELLSELTLAQHPARVGAHFVVQSPGDIASVAEKIVWVGVEGMDVRAGNCSFLLPSEREKVSRNAMLPDAESRSEVQNLLGIMPLLMAENGITLTFAENNGVESVTRHPLLLRLEAQVSNFKDFVEEPDVEALRSRRVDPVNNSRLKPEFEVKGSSRIVWPKLYSPTSLEKLTAHPFDYVFDRILKLRDAGIATLPDISTVKGTVAHAVIAKIFSESGTDGKNAYGIVDREFDNILAEAKRENGAVLDLPENSVGSEFFAIQLRECVERLIQIMIDNNLKAKEVEKHEAAYLGLDDSDGDDDTHGYMDMVLERADGTPVVFDFKWTTWEKGYEKKLEENRSIQLAVYAELLSNKCGRAGIPTAYFLMPSGTLLTTFAGFTGNRVKVLIPGSGGTGLLPMVINSFRYRKNQISCEGRLEGYDGNPKADLAYHADAVAKGLLPLPDSYDDTDCKEVNRFSSYQIFKGL